MTMYRDVWSGWPVGARFSSRLAALERLIRARRFQSEQFNLGLLNTLEAITVTDVWAGDVSGADAVKRFVSLCEHAAEHRGLRLPDDSIPTRLARLGTLAPSAKN